MLFIPFFANVFASVPVHLWATMATIEKRERDGLTVYRVKIRLRGYPPQSATFDRMTDAKAWAKETEVAIRSGLQFAEAKRHTLNELIESYSENASTHLRDWRTRARHLKYWGDELGDYLLSHITPSVLKPYRDKHLSTFKDRKGEVVDREGATINRYFASLSACLGYAVKELEWLDENPIEKITRKKETKGRVRFLSDDERERLLEVCRKSSSEELYLAVILALTTGARQMEIMGASWSQVDWKRKSMTLEQTKNGERRALPLVGEAFELLKERAKVRRVDTDLIFPATGRGKVGTPINLRKPWETALKEAGIEDFRWHDLRHTCASYLAMNGVSLLEISKILGHRTLQMVNRYSHLAEDHKSKVAEDMAKKIGLA